MSTSVNFNDLKKGNISVNAEKSKERIPQAYKGATKEQKDEIKKLTGFSPNNFYNVANSGTASPKVVLSLAIILDVSPLYFTGEIDQKKPCDAAVVAEIFANYSSGKPRKTAAAKRKSVKKAPTKAKAAPVKAAPAKAAPVKAAPAKAAPVKAAPAKAAPVKAAPAKAAPAKAAPVKAAPVKVPAAAPVRPAPAAQSVPIKPPVKMVRAPQAAIKAQKSTIDDDSLIKLLEALAIRAKYSDDAAITYDAVKMLLVK